MGLKINLYTLFFNPVVAWVAETNFSCALGAVYALVMVRWNRCSLNMIYCLSFNGYLHGVLTPGFPLGNQLGGSLYLQTPTTPVLEWTISARSSHVLHQRRALVVEGGALGFLRASLVGVCSVRARVWCSLFLLVFLRGVFVSDFSERVAASLMSLDGEVMDFAVFYSAEDSRGRFAPRLRIGEVAKGDEVLVGWFRGGEWVRADGVVVGSSSEFLIPDGEGGVAGG